jgi:GR25 family glycosyltransferase involved in LPS biosynthesis
MVPILNSLVTPFGNRYAVRFINLERAHERRASTERQLRAMGLADFVRFEAIDAARIDYENLGYVKGRGPYFELSMGEIACFESHRSLWKSHDFSKEPYLVILEDDIILSRSFRGVVESLIDADFDFDLVKLDFNPQSKRYGAEFRIGSVSVRPLFQSSASSAGYLITANCAEKLLKASRKYCETLDSFITSPSNKLLILQVFPAVACQAMWMPSHADEFASIAGSYIDMPRNGKKSKGGYFFKLRREVRKFGRAFESLVCRWTKGPATIRSIELMPDLAGSEYKIEAST